MVRAPEVDRYKASVGPKPTSKDTIKQETVRLLELLTEQYTDQPLTSKENQLSKSHQSLFRDIRHKKWHEQHVATINAALKTLQNNFEATKPSERELSKFQYAGSQMLWEYQRRFVASQSFVLFAQLEDTPDLAPYTPWVTAMSTLYMRSCDGQESEALTDVHSSPKWDLPKKTC